MKKIVSLLLCAVMIISVCALSACGEKGNGAVIPHRYPALTLRYH